MTFAQIFFDRDIHVSQKEPQFILRDHNKTQLKKTAQKYRQLGTVFTRNLMFREHRNVTYVAQKQKYKYYCLTTIYKIHNELA